MYVAILLSETEGIDNKYVFEGQVTEPETFSCKLLYNNGVWQNMIACFCGNYHLLSRKNVMLQKAEVQNMIACFCRKYRLLARKNAMLQKAEVTSEPSKDI